MNLRSLIVPAAAIEESRVQKMLELMQKYYLNVDVEKFRLDLKQKDLVILLIEHDSIYGFSTWKLSPFEIENRQINIIFSGDTIIERLYWHSLALPVAWGRLMLRAIADYPDRDLFWILTSKGYRTYRYLPIFFNEYYPSCLRDIPSMEKTIMIKYSNSAFGPRFDPITGTLVAGTSDQKLAPGISEITESRRKNRHIAFFEKINPGHSQGDELVCIARCHPDNIKPFIKKRIQS